MWKKQRGFWALGHRENLGDLALEDTMLFLCARLWGGRDPPYVRKERVTNRCALLLSRSQPAIDPIFMGRLAPARSHVRLQPALVRNKGIRDKAVKGTVAPCWDSLLESGPTVAVRMSRNILTRRWEVGVVSPSLVDH